MQSIEEFGQQAVQAVKNVFKNKDGKPIKRPTRRSVQNKNRGANPFGLKPLDGLKAMMQRGDLREVTGIVTQLPPKVEFFDLDVQAEIDRLAQHVRTAYDEALGEVDAINTLLALESETTDRLRPLAQIVDDIRAQNTPPDNGYDYRRDQESGFSDRANKPTGSNAWPWNRKLACCKKNEKECACGEWRRYY